MITRITQEIHVFIEWKLYLHYNGSGIHISEQWTHEFHGFLEWNPWKNSIIFTCF